MTVYKVTGAVPFLGHQPGEEFEAELTEQQERRAKQRGSIRVVKRETKPQKEDVDDA